MRKQGFALTMSLLSLGIVSVIVLAMLQWSLLTEQLARAPKQQFQIQQQRYGLIGPYQPEGALQHGACPRQYASWQPELVQCQLNVSAGSARKAGQLLYRQLLRSVQTMED